MIGLVCFLTILSLFTGSEAVVKLVATPVVYTNGNGGGSDELEVPRNADGTKLFNVGDSVAAAWWVPYDNIGDLSAIHRIDVVPSGSQVTLVVHGSPDQRSARVRIKIFASVSG